jgi:hypothetical protein
VRSVTGIQPHPNDAWSSEIDKATRRVKGETLAEWQRFWDSQQPLRVWPASLGRDFVQKVTTLKAGAKLPRPMLERYQNSVRAIVRTLPARMGADELMVDAAAGGPGQSKGPPPGMIEPGMIRRRPDVPEKVAALVQWNPADQQRLYASFNWDRPPSTLQVVLAQEELWVYGVLADAIARVNKSAAGAYNAPVPIVEQLAVGYPAAEDKPGGAGGGRIIVPVAAGQANPMGEFTLPPDQSMMEGGAVGRPAHPRFVGGAGPSFGPPGAPTPAEATASPDDLLRSWIYVDFAGKPLMAAELATSPDAQLVHLVPFVMRAVVDERKLDALLVDLATAPVPIDVRQVRINVGASGPGGGMPAMGGFGPGGGESGGQPAAAPGSRPHDVTLELRGTVALAKQPDPAAIGLEAAPQEDAEASDVEAAQPDPAPANAGDNPA